jgi:putative ABC transport system ATP-binding protein
LNGVRKRFRNPDGSPVTALDIPEFTLAAGERLLLRGPSGSGKSTFLETVSGIALADAGEIRINGQPLSGLGEAARDRLRAREIGVIFQSPRLMPGLSALENIHVAMRFGRGLDLDLARELMDRVGLADFSGHKPRQLSMGQQQRVALARALANRPALVLADEPTASLDPRRTREILSLLHELCDRDRSALLMVSHETDCADFFERVLDFERINRAPIARDPERPTTAGGIAETGAEA